MARLVALDLKSGPRFVAEVRRILDDGDAFLPLDQRLPLEDRRRLAHDMGAAVVRAENDEFALPNSRPVAPGDAVVIATSGSTGAPKGVVLTLDAVRSSARASSRRLGVDATAHWLACLPLSHVGGLSIIFKAWETSSALTLHERFDVESVLDAARAGCTHVSLVPTALRRIDPSLFACILLGGSRPPADRPSNVIATYGLTETGSGVVYDGRPLDDVEISITDDGEILVRSPMNMRTYRDGTTSIDSHGWLHTGDVGRFDGRTLQVDGRLDDLVKTGGEKVWPEAVERAIAVRLPEVELCIVGVDDEEWGQRVVAVTTDSRLTLDEVRGAVSESLPMFNAPKDLIRVGDLPRTSIGKIRRAEVARIALEALKSAD